MHRAGAGVCTHERAPEALRAFACHAPSWGLPHVPAISGLLCQSVSRSALACAAPDGRPALMQNAACSCWAPQQPPALRKVPGLMAIFAWRHGAVLPPSPFSGDEAALSTFSSFFHGKQLDKGSEVTLLWRLGGRRQRSGKATPAFTHPSVVWPPCLDARARAGAGPLQLPAACWPPAWRVWFQADAPALAHPWVPETPYPCRWPHRRGAAPAQRCRHPLRQPVPRPHCGLAPPGPRAVGPIPVAQLACPGGPQGLAGGGACIQRGVRHRPG